MKNTSTIVIAVLSLWLTSCGGGGGSTSNPATDLEILRGELALCGAADFGTIGFGQTCIESVQKDFELAVALLHSFEYAEAEKAFARVMDADPECAIAYWGVAMSNYHPLWAPPKPAELEKIAKVMEVAQSLPTKTERESRYINAIAVYYQDWETLDHKTRARKYVDAMKQLYEEHPEDVEAAVFYALALNSIVDPKDKTFALQKQAGEILNKLFPDEPDHPGVAHYIIHTFDYPELAHLALESARKYATIAPSSAHAQHMPSHIFTRLGLWDESITSNLASAEAAKCYVENLGSSGRSGQELHAWDYLMYAYLQSSRLDEADELLNRTLAINEIYQPDFTQAYAMAAMPVRYHLELRRWEDAANAPLLLDTLPWENHPWEASIVSFARVLGAVNQGNLKKAGEELGRLKANHDTLVAKQDEYKATQVRIQIKASEAWIALAEGKKDLAIQLMTEAADLEDGTGKHPVTPGEVLPARELLGDLYMKLSMYGKALEAYEASIARHQNRFNSLYGAGRAAEKLGDKEKARSYYYSLLSISKSATGERAELEEARAYMERTGGMELTMR